MQVQDTTTSIRPASEDDLGHVGRMIAAIHHIERGLQGSPVLSPEQIKDTYLDKILDRVRNHNGEILVYEIDGEVVGCIVGFMEVDEDLAVDPAFHNYALISDIYVVPSMRRLAVGRALVDAFSDEMKKKGSKWLRIWAKSKNTAAIEAYMNYGFENYETVFIKPL